MKQFGLWFGTLVLINGINIAYANHHEAGEDACEGADKAAFCAANLDVNKDGVITRQEYLDGDKNNTEKTFNHLDANNDGVLDLSEQYEIEAVYKKIHDEYKAKTKTI